MKLNVNFGIKLDGKQSLDKDYFDRKMSLFKSKYYESGIIEHFKLKRYFLKPAIRAKIKQQLKHRKKW